MDNLQLSAGCQSPLATDTDLLDFDLDLTKVIDKNNLFVTFRLANTLGYLLVYSRYRVPTKMKPDIVCFSCNKCVLVHPREGKNASVDDRTISRILSNEYQMKTWKMLFLEYGRAHNHNNILLFQQWKYIININKNHFWYCPHAAMCYVM